MPDVVFVRDEEKGRLGHCDGLNTTEDHTDSCSDLIQARASREVTRAAEHKETAQRRARIIVVVFLSIRRYK